MTNKTKQKNNRIFVLAVSFIFIANASLASASEITAKKMVELTNGSRSEAGLGSLTVNGKLEQAANAKASDMFFKQYFEHTSPEGVAPWYWFNQAGYEYVYAAENLAIDFITAEGAHSALMKSTGHRENILGANYKDIGIAVVSGEFEGRDSIIIVEEFGSQREHMITINNAPFFETVSEVKVEEKVKTEEQTKLKSAPTPSIVPAPQIVTQVEIEEVTTPVEDIKPDSEIEVSKQSDKSDLKNLGKIIPEVYAVRNVQQLKKVYTEDIYWESAEDEGLIESLGDNATTKLKILFRDLTGSILYALL